MLKSLLIKLRRQPKIVREQFSLIVAGVFTFLIFAVWAFTLPGQFEAGEDSQTAGVFSSFKEAIMKEEAPLKDFGEKFKAATASSTEEEATPEVFIETEPSASTTTSTTSETSTTSTKEVRLITTSSSSNLQSEVE